ncbi:MAG: hypothetical protein GY865_12580 [candidate division Zixibacteria bacterium]|nr:hypothetical protein [candidate division Zixibacteria bacterium]
MSKRINTQTLGAVLMIAMGLLYGCSGGEDTGQFSAVKQAVDTAATQIAEDFVEASFASVTLDKNFVEAPELLSEKTPGVNEIIIYDSVLYAATNDGVIAYNFTDQSTGCIGNGKTFRSLAFHDGNLYTASDRLYIIKDNMLEPVALEFEGQITNLLSDSNRLLIGTDQGLISKGLISEECLLDDVNITCMTFDNNGLWVGTDGQGLFRWDGDRFLKRHLVRDTTIFDYVYDIAFNHDHLFVGAATGFFVYDGGRWEHWTDEIGMPSNIVNSIDASDWMVYVGTDKGVISYFDKNLYPVRKFETMPADVVRLMGNKVIAADENGGIFVKRGYSVRTLIEPVKKENTEVFTQADSDI